MFLLLTQISLLFHIFKPMGEIPICKSLVIQHKPVPQSSAAIVLLLCISSQYLLTFTHPIISTVSQYYLIPMFHCSLTETALKACVFCFGETCVMAHKKHKHKWKMKRSKNQYSPLSFVFFLLPLWWQKNSKLMVQK